MKRPAIRLLSLAAAIAATAASTAAAADAPETLPGADALVAAIAEAMPPPPSPTAEDPRNLIDAITALRNDGAARRDPDLRAARWLELAARAEAIGLAAPLDPTPEGRWIRNRALPQVVRHLVAALPPPSRWPAMREALDGRAAVADPANPPPALSALRLALARLSGDKAAASKALSALQRTPGAADKAKTKALRKALFGRGQPRRTRGAGRGRSITGLLRAIEGETQDETLAEAFAGVLEVYGPDHLVVTDEDLERPDELLAVIPASTTLPWVYGTDAALARFRALVRAAGTNAPATAVMWSFADPTPDGLAYFAERAAARNAPAAWEDEFARLAARGPDVLLSECWVEVGGLSFHMRPTPNPNPSEPTAYLRAVTVLCGRDLAAGRIEDAEARLDAALPEAIRPAVALAAAASARRGFDPVTMFFRPSAPSAALAEFVERRALPPAAPATEEAIKLLLRTLPKKADAASAARLAALAERLKADPDTPPAALDALEHGRLATDLAADLADNRFDDAMAAARRLAKRKPAKRLPSGEDDQDDEESELLLGFARAMLAAGETNRFDQALALLHSAAGSRGDGPSAADEAALLARAGRTAGAQALYAEDLLRKIRERKESGELDLASGSYPFFTRDLDALAELYLDAGRPADALALFERVPLWGVADASGLRGDSPRLLARALDGTGRTDDAVRVARHAIEVAGAYHRDWPWELLLERLPAEDFLALADRMHGLVPWEERPVQWKAEALRRAGRLAEAEEAARLALQIDPTDGESPDGDRIRSYSILASILEEKGGEDAAKEAATLRSVVAAVRLAEKGDDLSCAGLSSRALDAYDRAAALFEDAYCVQWRLAERLRERGFPELAAEHYEETFRRMPEQFGRVASLCFGCTGVFASGESLSAAERILPGLAARPGALPATHRLLGMLRAEQGRLHEAWDAFRAALDADPGYLDALADLLALRGKLDRPRADWADLQRRAFELDPLGLRLRIEPGDILDWTFVREANAAARARLPDAPESLLPLPASAEALAAKPASRRDAWEYRLSSISGRDTLADRAFDAAAAFAAMDDPPTWLGALCTWLDTPASR